MVDGIEELGVEVLAGARICRLRVNDACRSMSFRSLSFHVSRRDTYRLWAAVSSSTRRKGGWPRAVGSGGAEPPDDVPAAAAAAAACLECHEVVSWWRSALLKLAASRARDDIVSSCKRDGGRSQGAAEAPGGKIWTQNSHEYRALHFFPDPLLLAALILPLVTSRAHCYAPPPRASYSSWSLISRLGLSRLGRAQHAFRYFRGLPKLPIKTGSAPRKPLLCRSPALLPSLEVSCRVVCRASISSLLDQLG